MIFSICVPTRWLAVLTGRVARLELWDSSMASAPAFRAVAGCGDVALLE
jgi:hypothetical protein